MHTLVCPRTLVHTHTNYFPEHSHAHTHCCAHTHSCARILSFSRKLLRTQTMLRTHTLLHTPFPAHFCAHKQFFPLSVSPHNPWSSTWHIWHTHIHTSDTHTFIYVTWLAACHTSDTGWYGVIWCLILIGHFQQKSPVISGSFTENDLQLKASYESSPRCTWHSQPLILGIPTHSCMCRDSSRTHIQMD